MEVQGNSARQKYVFVVLNIRPATITTASSAERKFFPRLEYYELHMFAVNYFGGDLVVRQTQ